jgi:endoglucanase
MNNKESVKLLKELTEAVGVSGYEEEIRKIIKNELNNICDIELDRLGSIICKKQGKEKYPKIMIPAHMDEIGFMVKSITDDGFIKFGAIGGWFDQTLLSQRVIIKTKKDEIIGVIGSKPPHLLPEEERKKVVERKNMFIDIGAKNKKEVEEKFGIKPGDPIIPYSTFTLMKNNTYAMAKALDDRIGCAIFIEVIKRLEKTPHPNTVYGVGTVQEEVGIRGAKTSSWVVEPDVAIIADVGIANDTPGSTPDEITGRLGNGPQIGIYDAGMIPNIKLRDLAIEIAKNNKIPYQFEYLERGATDGAAVHIHTKGVPAIYIGVPTRYIHSHVGIFSLEDYENTVKLYVELVKALDKKTVEKLVE